MSILRAALLPAFVIPPWRRVRPLECSDGTRPRYAMSWRGLVKRECRRVLPPVWLRPPVARRARLAGLQPPVRETTPATLLRYVPPVGRAAPSLPRRPRYNLPAQYDVPPGRT